MTKTVDITLVLDESSSMSHIRDATLSGVNEYLDKIRGDGNTLLSLVKFADTVHTQFVAHNLADIKQLTAKDYTPHGMTALYDAIGIAITNAGHRLEFTPVGNRPDKVLFIIQTDGHENSSREFTRERIKSMIDHQQVKYSWDFVFLGANQDAIVAGADIGIAANKSMTFAPNAIGAKSMYGALDGYTKTLRAASAGDEANVGFTAANRTEQFAAGAVVDKSSLPSA